MKFYIATASDLMSCRTDDALRAKHATFIAKKQAHGSKDRIHESHEPVPARVNHGCWLFDCDCGSDVGADPESSNGYCFGCGAIHTNVVFPEPDDRLNIEHMLLARHKTANRNWFPEERLLDLAIQNVRRGVRF